MARRTDGRELLGWTAVYEVAGGKVSCTRTLRELGSQVEKALDRDLLDLRRVGDATISQMTTDMRPLLDWIWSSTS